MRKNFLNWSVCGSQLKLIFYRTWNRNNLEYITFSTQIRLIIEEQDEIEHTGIFHRRLSRIIPGPRAFRELYNFMGRKENSQLLEKSINGVKVDITSAKLCCLKGHFESICSINMLPDHIFIFHQWARLDNLYGDAYTTSIDWITFKILSLRDCLGLHLSFSLESLIYA